MSFAENLKQLRNEKQLSQEELAHIILGIITKAINLIAKICRI